MLSVKSNRRRSRAFPSPIRTTQAKPSEEPRLPLRPAVAHLNRIDGPGFAAPLHDSPLPALVRPLV
ncbi:MAG TPA: hypothetical protein VFU72_13750 [Nitrolancea sp.]|nr:hypothetical protein [Nitrolancea sp.]